MPLGADFGERALAVGAALLAAEAEAPAWRQQVGAGWRQDVGWVLATPHSCCSPATLPCRPPQPQQAETVQSLEAAAQPLQGLLQAAASAGDAAHSASMLLTLGSLQDISRRQGDEIAALTDLDHATAAACAAFFQGRAARPTPHGLPLGVPLQHL